MGPTGHGIFLKGSRHAASPHGLSLRPHTDIYSPCPLSGARHQGWRGAAIQPGVGRSFAATSHRSGSFPSTLPTKEMVVCHVQTGKRWFSRPLYPPPPPPDVRQPEGGDGPAAAAPSCLPLPHPPPPSPAPGLEPILIHKFPGGSAFGRRAVPRLETPFPGDGSVNSLSPLLWSCLGAESSFGETSEQSLPGCGRKARLPAVITGPVS